jgi:hypothetical protein
MGLETQSVDRSAPHCIAGKITPMLARETLEGSVAKCYLQVGIVSPLLRKLVVDKLVIGLNENDCYTLGYADDSATLITQKLPNAMFMLPREALCMVQQDSCPSIHKRW